MNKSSTGFRSIDPDKHSLKEVHNLLLSGVSPRPIALVSTISEDGVDNLAPFSFFNAFGANPPYIAFSPANSGKDGSAKDTLLNLEEIPECVVHAVPFDIMEQVLISSTAYPSEVDEFVKAGFKTLDSEVVRPKRVMNSPFHMECLVEQIIPLGGTNGSGNLVLCRVVRFHASETVMEDEKMSPHALDLIGRNGFNFYTRASGSALLQVDKPAGVGIGIDGLPKQIRESHLLTGNDLGKLGLLESLPSSEEALEYIKRVATQNPVGEHRSLLIEALAQEESDATGIKEKLELAVKAALDCRDMEFAAHVLVYMISF